MLAGFGWLVVVWVIWTAVFIATMWMIRFTMHGQQEFVTEQEAEINAAQAGHGANQPAESGVAATGAAGTGPARPPQPERQTPRTPTPLGPPLSAT